MACITTSPCSPSPVAGWSGRFSQIQSNRQGGYGENAVIRFSSTVWCETRTCAPCRHTPQGLVGRIPSEQTPFQRPRGVHGPQSLSLPNICHRMGGPLVLDEGLSCWLSTALCIVPAVGSVGSDPTQSDAGPLRQGRLQHAWSMSRGIKP